MTEPTPLSPAAQAVLDAFDAAALAYPNFRVEPMIAAALRAVADQVVPQGGPFLMTASEDRVRHQLLAIAADLLEQRQAAPVPVPVSERLPGPEDCDNADRVWCWNWRVGAWRLSRIDQSIHSHWLPAHALPIPTTEPQP